MSDELTAAAPAVASSALFAWLFGEKIAKRSSYLIIPVRGCRNNIPSGIPVGPEVGWGAVECLGHEPSSTAPQATLPAKPSGEAEAERRLTDPLKGLGRKLEGSLAGIDEIVGKWGGKQTSVHLRNIWIICTCQNLHLLERGRMAVRYAVNVFKGYRGVKNLSGVVYEEVMWEDIYYFGRIAAENHQYPVAISSLFSGQGKSQGCDEGVLTATPPRIGPPIWQRPARISEKESEESDCGTGVHVGTKFKANVSDQATASARRC